MQFRFVKAALAVAVAILMAPPSVWAQDRFEWDGVLAAGKTIEIKGINGSIEAESTSGNRVEVVAIKEARRSDTSTVGFEVIEHSDGVTICAVYPSRNQDRPNECEPGSEGRMNVRDNDVEVKFTVRVRDGVHFTGRNVNGRVKANSIGGNVEAYTVNGNVEVSADGLVRAKTVNGSIEVVMGRSDWEDELEFETVNGTITVEMPASTNADVRAETLNGSITTDFPLTLSGRFGSRRINGTIGSGGKDLRLKTVNGRIRLRRSS